MAVSMAMAGGEGWPERRAAARGGEWHAARTHAMAVAGGEGRPERVHGGGPVWIEPRRWAAGRCGRRNEGEKGRDLARELTETATTGWGSEFVGVVGRCGAAVGQPDGVGVVSGVVGGKWRDEN